MSDDDKFSTYVITGIILFAMFGVACVTYSDIKGNAHDEAMAKLGYCQTGTAIGKVWQKCEVIK